MKKKKKNGNIFFDFKENFLKIPFYKNSLFIYLSLITSSAFGFIFWVISAKYFSPSDVGIVIAIISSINLIITISRLGLDQSIIRYIHSFKPSDVLVTSLYITTLSTILFSAIYFIIIYYIENIDIIIQIWPIFIFLVVGTSILNIFSVMFNAIRHAEYNFFQNVVMGSRILFLFLLNGFGKLGMLFSIGFSFFISIPISSFFLFKNNLYSKDINWNFIKDSLSFTVGNYFSNILFISPNYIIPIISISLLGPEKTAYYFITYSIVSILYMIPNSISLSVFIEGSHGESMKKIILKSFEITYAFLIPLSLLIFYIGEPLLGFIGPDYSNMNNFLQIMIFSSFFVSNIFTYFSFLRIKNEMKKLIILNLLLFVLLITLTYFFIVYIDLIGIAYAWLISYFLSNLAILIVERNILMNTFKQIRI